MRKQIVMLLFAGFVASCNVINPPKDDKFPPWLLILLPANNCTPTLIAGTHQGCPLNLAGTVTTIAGPAPGSNTQGDTDATALSARFSAPYGMITDGTNIFTTDVVGNKIRTARDSIQRVAVSIKSAS